MESFTPDFICLFLFIEVIHIAVHLLYYIMLGKIVK